MTLQETAQILGGIGVIASLIYVGIQIRNNARALRAATYQQLSVINLQGWISMAHNGETTGVVLRGMDDFFSLTRVEKARFNPKFVAHLDQILLRQAETVANYKPPQPATVKSPLRKTKTTKA